MATKKNYQGNQQNYDTENGEYRSGPKGAFNDFGKSSEKGYDLKKEQDAQPKFGSKEYVDKINQNYNKSYEHLKKNGFDMEKFKDIDTFGDYADELAETDEAKYNILQEHMGNINDKLAYDDYTGANKSKANQEMINGKKVVDEVPDGWVENTDATTTPKGYKLYTNNKSRFGGERESVYVKDKSYQPSEKDNALETLKKFGVDTSKLKTAADVYVLTRTHPIHEFSREQGDEFFNATDKLREILQKEALPRAKRDTSKDITPEFDEEVNEYYELNGRQAPSMYGGAPVDNIKKYFKEKRSTIDDDIAYEKHSIEEVENEYKDREMHPNLKAYLDKKKKKYNWLVKNRDRLETYYNDID